jgi:hypothetical protein
MLGLVSALPYDVPVPGWPVVFRGSEAVRAGLVTKAQLRGPRFQRLFPDTFLRRTGESPTLAGRSVAAHVYGRGRGVLSGYSAAEVLGASCGPADAPAELTMPGGGRSRPGLLVHRDQLLADEVQIRRGMSVTTPLRTAYDLARRLELVEAVVALDALARRGCFDPVDVLRLAGGHPGARGRAQLPRVVDLAARSSGSPMETRLRLVLVLRGLPRPEVQHPVLDDRRRRAVWLDLAYPAQRVGIEYEGVDHTRPEGVLRDIGRYTWLVDEGWRMFRFTKFEVYGGPDEVAATVGRAVGVAPTAPRWR